MKVKSLRQILKVFALSSATTLLTGCDNVIMDYEGDCSVHYKVAFTYTQNMEGADAFASQLSSVTLYVVDKSGRIVTSKTESGESIKTPGYKMDVDVAPGTYDLLVWGQGEAAMDDATAFSIASGSTPTTVTQLTATLPLQGSEGDFYSNRDIKPLFHGMISDVEFPDTYGDVTVESVDLMKDTNVFQVLIQSIDGSEIPDNEFSFYITADNSELSYGNSVISTESFQYRPWKVTETSASFDGSENNNESDSRAGETVNGLLGELTTGRLITDRRQTLVVHRNSDDTDVIRINLIDYLLMVKGEYNRLLTNQQYLDRMGYYTLMFFLDADRNWFTAGGVYINGWRIVPDESVII